MNKSDRIKLSFVFFFLSSEINPLTALTKRDFGVFKDEGCFRPLYIPSVPLT